MKQAACIVGICFLSAFALTAEAAKVSDAFRRALVRGARARVIVSVHDDEGAPVSDAAVTAAIARGDDEYSIHGSTDINGKWIFDGETTGNYIQISVHKSGYYDSKIKFSYIDMGAEHEVKDGKWQPYGVEEKIVLRKILNPTRMVSNIESMAFDYSIIATNVLIGFDMEKNDLVSPHGKGEIADFYIEFQSDGLPPNASKYSKLTVTYSTPLGAAYEVPVSAQSDFKGRYSVECDKFDAAPLIFVNRVTESGRRKDRLGQKKMAVIRSRCKVDEQGRLNAANYSTLDYLSFSTSFDGPGCCRIHFHFNPIPNDTNLEPKRERGR